MFGRKKKQKQKKPSRFARLTSVFLWNCFKRAQLRERIAKANAWATAHKKQTAGITIGLLSFSLMLGVLSSIVSMKNSKSGDNPLNEIEDVNPMFQGIRQIQDAKSFQKEQVTDLLQKGKRLKTELDSLVAIEDKTHRDSVRIVVTYKQLDIIARTLKNK